MRAENICTARKMIVVRVAASGALALHFARTDHAGADHRERQGLESMT
jgi:hypothetical protein